MSIKDFQECSGSVPGCFASDPEALEYAQFNGDLGIMHSNRALMHGAVEAARQGIPFEEATYNRVTHASMQVGVPGPSTRISELAEGDHADEMQLRVARCAYACGSATLGNCPLITR
jgi:hypothetical protein